MVRAANEKTPPFYVGLSATLVACVLLVYYDLGSIAFVLVVFAVIWGWGLRDKFSNETTASAYSVFNKDGRSIVGGFTANQLERQLRGPLASGNHNSDDPVCGQVAEHSGASASASKEQVSDKERLRRRRAAADAAQRRLQSKEDN